jgi:hypothetical protein
MSLSKGISDSKLMRKCGGYAISARRKVEWKRVNGSMF